MHTLHFIVLCPFLFALFVPLLYKYLTPRVHTGWFVLLVPITLFLYLLRFVPRISEGNNLLRSVPWMPSFNFDFTLYLDGLGLIFGLLITGIGALVILYSIYYMSKHTEALHNFYVYLLLFMGAMLGVVFSDNILLLYVFWELTSISSFLLIAYWYQRERSRYGAQKSMMITIFGGLSMLAGFIMLSMITGTYSIRDMISHVGDITSDSLFIPAMILILLGAFTKSAQFPFSIWLPGAMEAPTPISAYLHSATMVKAGIYLVARFTPVFGGEAEWFWLVSGIGLVTLLYGSLNAVKQTDLKALLAYSTISQLGLIMSLFGVGSAALYFTGSDESSVYAVAVLAAVFHLINHSTFKGALFMVVGIIDHETGTRDIRKLGGLMQIMPVSFTLALIGAFSMAGLPPFNGFLSKEMFFTAMLDASKMSIFNMDTLGALFPAVAWVASVFTFIYCLVLVFKTFRGKYKPERLDKKPHEAPLGMLIPPIVLASLVVGIFFFPNALSKYFLQPASHAVLPGLPENVFAKKISAWHGFNPELIMTVGVVLFGILLYRSRKSWVGLLRRYPEPLTLNSFYALGLERGEEGSRFLTEKYMTGSIRDYIVYTFGFLTLLAGGALLVSNRLSFSSVNNAPITLFEGAIAVALLTASFAVLFAKTRMASIIALGGIGYLVSILFVIFRAPDLALTQMVIETVTTVLFLLCYYHLPKFPKAAGRMPFKPLNLIISLGVGATVTLFALASNGNRMFEPISSYYKNSYELAGAKNIVNAILVDFRGIDTMMEISVLSIAALGVFTLIKLNLDRGGKNEETK
ncbi:Na+/H+ antiporter subunit A [Neobacillus piezotolerans]|uniref:Na+/H+ antiporter subunit A n=1 Tax=Neobacillus piezotolerans TaxID=2259171 RepID=A0A3D8GX23_9BACI|nr:Na+/H+ antiporter subunit A [Neobacillus piezotolerans]RDU38731.1 Na+/H+ antiporter subunit A [Neobacillus piezotolerans]